MPREAAESPPSFGFGRAALEAVAHALPDVPPGSPLSRALHRDAGPLREALLRAVVRAAFLVGAEARALLSSADGARLRTRLRTEPGAWPFGAEAWRAALAAAQEALSAAAGAHADERFGPDELGAVYEGMLATSVALAEVPSAVVELPRRAGSTVVEKLVPISRLTDAEKRRAMLVAPGRVALVRSVERRRAGAHYTPRALAERVVEVALGPLVAERGTREAVLALTVCDPSLGTGAFLLAAARYLAGRLGNGASGVRGLDDARDGAAPNGAMTRQALLAVVEHCVRGVDRDALAVETARYALWLALENPALSLDFLDERLVVGDALVGPPTSAAIPRELATFDWERAFPDVLAAGGFDAFVGNPPWVSYAGRAAQPLASALRRVYSAYEAFHGYRNLQGLFVERTARLLKPGGRLGLVLPSSMSELAGYAPTRRAHDRYAAADDSLPDLGADAFEGVFQPCMVLVSTRRAHPLEHVATGAWPIERPDLDAPARALIAKLAQEPLPSRLFGERGLQSTGEDTKHFAPQPDARHSVPLRSGGDIEAFALRPPSAHADPAWFGARLRAPDEWARIRLVVRQTARVPVAALSDGTAFRNSLLAGFEDDEYPAAFLVAYLNSTPIRWLHYVRHRDARQGMPQLKVAHLRATPAPPSRSLVAALCDVGVTLCARGHGVGAREQLELDELVASAFDIDAKERKRLADFRASVADARPRA